ncbi:MAG: transporter substrate-binding domain-containing protein [Deltaproteobacteria bacterium]
MTRNLKVFFLLFLFLLLCLHPAVLFAQSRSDVASPSGKKLIVGILHDPPYLIKENTGEWTGINVDIWKDIAQDLKIDYELKEMTFEGLLEALKTNEIDLAIEAFFILAEREKQIDYSSALGSTRLGLATLPGKIHHPWWMAVSVLLSWGTFRILGTLCLALCMLGFLLWVIERKNNPDHFGGGTLRGIVSGIYWVGSTLASGVCFGVNLKSFPARLLGLVWMLLCAVALSALIASLTSTISANRSMVDIVSDEQLRNMRLGGIRESAESITLKKLGGKYTLYDNETTALNAVLNREIEGFLYDEITLRYYKENDYKEKISISPTGFKRIPFAFGLPNESPLRKKINYALLSLMEKPGWAFLLKRYGLGENFEEIQLTDMEKRKKRHGN